jgi:transglutaminase-like putative cysteine protease
MRVAISATLDYQICGNQAILLGIEAARTDGQTILDADLDVGGAALHRIGDKSKVGEKVWVMAAEERFIVRYRATVDVDRPVVHLESLAPSPMYALPGDVITYIRPSRFCQSDLFTDFVGRHFGHLTGGAKIAAIVNWVATEITYVSGSSGPATTAVDTFATYQGVCRDFAHLLCSLLRAANIPARYTSVYGAHVAPADFHAVVQVWAGGCWHIIDPTGMGCASGLVVIGTGRDAADVAFMETDQWVQMNSLTVEVLPV